MDSINPSWITVVFAIGALIANIATRLQSDRSKPEELIHTLRLDLGKQITNIEVQIAGIPEKVMEKAEKRFMPVERHQVIASQVDDLHKRMERLERTA